MFIPIFFSSTWEDFRTIVRSVLTISKSNISSKKAQKVAFVKKTNVMVISREREGKIFIFYPIHIQPGS